MHDFTREDLRSLLAIRGVTAVSAFLPVHPQRGEQDEDIIRMRNMLKDAEARCRAKEMRQADVDAFLSSAYSLLDDAPFWRSEGAGLALFVANGTTRSWRLPVEFREHLYVGRRMHIKPLLPLVAGDIRFYVLALSQSQAKLFSATRFVMREVDLTGVPAGLADALSSYEFDKQLQFHTAGAVSRPAGGGRPVAFHGHGSAADDDKSRIAEYFRHIDRALADYLRGKRAPMVLAGVDYMRSLYKEVNSYPELLDDGVSGSPDEWDERTLHEKAWQAAEPAFSAERQRALERFGDLMSSSLATSEMRTILSAARFGRVSTLFAAEGVDRWGRFDALSGSLELHATAGIDDDELVDRASADTISHGGRVYPLPAEEMPAPAPLAAILRY